MIRLGHIEYSNCIPVHALLLEEPVEGVRLLRDVPSRLNAALAAGVIDAAPCSSIEYARHDGRYRILPAHAIGSAGAVHSILLESDIPLTDLDGKTVAIPGASATSVVLLRILLELRLGIRPQYIWFDQAETSDPLMHGAAAALRIGDIALRRQPGDARLVHDLGAEWHDWTGLPFAFAVWQVRREMPEQDVIRLVELLHRSRSWYAQHTDELASKYAPASGLNPRQLLTYWSSLRFDLDAPMQQGLLRFYEYAAELGEAGRTTALDIVGA